ncbi:MAG TPA: nitroreductase family protein [Candidatus Hydrogenedentes bacterium]|nr:nitroreductase family protein [Candidatus Hydrogenedentota bacterium]HPG69374.1 nitroreductase family protein [Candidatus Hydrogenedentota bacterium]
MDKSAETRFPVHELIRRRWSPVTYSDRPVALADLGSLFEAARWAASCYNDQPWRFLVASKEHEAEYRRMLGCLVEKNQAWAASAPVLILAVASVRFEFNGRENRWARHDIGMAVMSLLLEAADLGLHAHAMAGFDPDRARETFGIPEGFEPVTAIAAGYLGDVAAAPEAQRQRDETPRSRRPLESIVFAGQWGNTADFVK